MILYLIYVTIYKNLSIYINLYINLYIYILGECPQGVAWTDKAYATDKAHQLVTCSNAGTCDISNGTCTCFDGYTGDACQRSMSISILFIISYIYILYILHILHLIYLISYSFYVSVRYVSK